MGKLYFNKAKYYMRTTMFDNGWTDLIDGKKVYADSRNAEVYLCKADGYTLPFEVIDKWCVKHYPRRHTLANYKHKHCRYSK